MKIYVDLIFFLNFMFDFILLITTNIVLKRKSSLKRITLGSLIGSLTIIVLFVPLTTLSLFILKILLSISIMLITFGYKDLKYTLTNLFYFYILFITNTLVYLLIEIQPRYTYFINVTVFILGSVGLKEILKLWDKRKKFLRD